MRYGSLFCRAASLLELLSPEAEPKSTLMIMLKQEFQPHGLAVRSLEFDCRHKRRGGPPSPAGPETWHRRPSNVPSATGASGRGAGQILPITNYADLYRHASG